MLRYSLLMLIFWFSLGTFGLSAQEDNSLVIVLEDDRFLLVPQYSSPAQLEYSMDWEPDQRDLKKPLLASLLAPFPLPAVPFPTDLLQQKRSFSLGASIGEPGDYELRGRLYFPEAALAGDFVPSSSSDFSMHFQQWYLRGAFSPDPWRVRGDFDLPLRGILNNHLNIIVQEDLQLGQWASSLNLSDPYEENLWRADFGLSLEEWELSTFSLGASGDQPGGNWGIGAAYELNSGLIIPLLYFSQSVSPFLLQLWSQNIEDPEKNPNLSGLAVSYFHSSGEWRLAYEAKHRLLGGDSTGIIGQGTLSFARPLFYSHLPLSISLQWEHQAEAHLIGGRLDLPWAFNNSTLFRLDLNLDYRMDFSSSGAKVYNGSIGLDLDFQTWFVYLSLGLASELPFGGITFGM
jgi:hypothetical protein